MSFREVLFFGYEIFCVAMVTCILIGFITVGFLRTILAIMREVRLALRSVWADLSLEVEE